MASSFSCLFYLTVITCCLLFTLPANGEVELMCPEIVTDGVSERHTERGDQERERERKTLPHILFYSFSLNTLS